MSTFTLRSLPGGQRHVRSVGVAGMVRREFGRYRYLTDFVAQCFVAMEGECMVRRDALAGVPFLPDSVVAGILAHMRCSLERRFGRVDADPDRTQALFAQFMPFHSERLCMAIAPQEFAPLRERMATENSAFLSFLIVGQGAVTQRWVRTRLAFINALTWMAVIPSPDVVANNEELVASLVNRLLKQEDTSEEPTYVPLPGQAAKTTYPEKRVPPVPRHQPPPCLRLVEDD